MKARFIILMGNTGTERDRERAKEREREREQESKTGRRPESKGDTTGVPLEFTLTGGAPRMPPTVL